MTIIEYMNANGINEFVLDAQNKVGTGDKSIDKKIFIACPNCKKVIKGKIVEFAEMGCPKCGKVLVTK